MHEWRASSCLTGRKFTVAPDRKRGGKKVITAASVIQMYSRTSRRTNARGRGGRNRRDNKIR